MHAAPGSAEARHGARLVHGSGDPTPLEPGTLVLFHLEEADYAAGVKPPVFPGVEVNHRLVYEARHAWTKPSKGCLAPTRSHHLIVMRARRPPHAGRRHRALGG